MEISGIEPLTCAAANAARPPAAGSNKTQEDSGLTPADKIINLLPHGSKLYIKRILSAPSVVEISGNEPLTS